MIICVLESVEYAPERQVYFVESSRISNTDLRRNLEDKKNDYLVVKEDALLQDLQSAIVALPQLVEHQVDVWI
jgi:hypothetical protein